MKRATGATLSWLTTPGTVGTAPLHRQVYQRIRGAILAGELLPQTRLPSTRVLAADLGVSRNTVELAFSQLEAEEFLVRRRGSGSFVCRSLPGRPRGLPNGQGMRGGFSKILSVTLSSVSVVRPPLSPRGQALVVAGELFVPTDPPLAFGPCVPALDHFPLPVWNRLLAKHARLSGRRLLGTGDAAGYRPLREAIAAYLGAARGVRCHWRQVIVTTSTQQSLELTARLLLEPGDRVWMEEPGYRQARAALAASRLRIVPVPVDANGMNVAAGRKRAPRARFAYVTPSHQYPLGVTLSLERRLELLRWAEGAGAWIFEDDYDSEFRYAGRPLAALQGLDNDGQILYAGTFHKVLFPALRLAYLVVPESLIDAFTVARGTVDGFSPPLTQAVVADFITQGHFAAHLRLMRTLYRQRRDVLLRALAAEPTLAALLRLGPTQAGMHFAGWLPENTDDRQISDAALALGLGIPPLSRYYADPRGARPGLVFHYAATAPEVMKDGIQRLGKRLTPVRKALRSSKVVPSTTP